ncbi:unnamed protein product [Enterobius vermicularis]|uniref:Uncharacterized protein n=1 Tax=Enterobius vermicularis TaxID=51028 RepID=A0A0N4USR7_ENTVE|nr:unnamed protein product [Enterobius vermicularis]
MTERETVRSSEPTDAVIEATGRDSVIAKPDRNEICQITVEDDPSSLITQKPTLPKVRNVPNVQYNRQFLLNHFGRKCYNPEDEFLPYNPWRSTRGRQCFQLGRKAEANLQTKIDDFDGLIQGL